MKHHIIVHIKEHGPLSVADYMQMCLYTPDTGYYMHGMPFGKDGDFITAPELTPLFGEMLGLWVAATWQQMGAPKSFNLVECGPGRGTLFADMLSAIQKALPDCAKAIRGHLVDISPNLKNHQKQTLKAAPCPIKWHESIETVPFDVPSILIGNELMDAFPVKQYELQNGSYFERLVATDGDTLTLTLSKTATDLQDHTTPTVEHSPMLDAFLTDLQAKLSACPKAAMLLIDYGTEGHESGESLQALRRHKFEGIFDTPGHADLTWHIPFGHVCDILQHDHVKVTDMALFLTEIGFVLRAEQALRATTNEDQKEHIKTTTQRLLDPNQMGAHFKVLGWWSENLTQLQGFQHTYANPE